MKEKIHENTPHDRLRVVIDHMEIKTALRILSCDLNNFSVHNSFVEWLLQRKKEITENYDPSDYQSMNKRFEGYLSLFLSSVRGKSSRSSADNASSLASILRDYSCFINHDLSINERKLQSEKLRELCEKEIFGKGEDA